jgi:hypothetical protein
MSRRRSFRRSSLLVLTGAALLVAGCTSPGSGPTAAVAPTTSGRPLVSSTLAVPDGLAEGPFDEPRQVLAPEGGSVSLWARVPTARLAAWAPDGSLLVSRPKAGDVLALTPSSGAEPPA